MTILADEASRARQRAIEHDWKPRNCVWELTLACNLRCRHCGSSAGRPLPEELEQCCGVDPCATVCCECDYGVIPEDYYAYCCMVVS